METIKHAMGLGPSNQAGQEPVSGQTGEGTATAPYDAGNQQGTFTSVPTYLTAALSKSSADHFWLAEDPNLAGKAPQETGETLLDFSPPPISNPLILTLFQVPQSLSDTPSSNPTHDELAVPNSSTNKPLEPSANTFTTETTTASTGESAKSTSSPPTIGGESTAQAAKVEPTPAPTSPVETKSEAKQSGVKQSEPQQNAPRQSGAAVQGKPTIGGPAWFTTALPTEKQQSTEEFTSKTAAGPTTTEPPAQSTGTSAPAPALKPALKDLPPNHLSDDVPKGYSEDLDTNTRPPPATKPTPPPTAMSSEQQPTGGAMSATQPIPDEGGVGAAPKASSPGIPSRDLPGTRGSIAPEKPDHSSAPLKPADASHPVHHGHGGSIPTAGGVPVGQAAGEARRASIAERKSMQAGGPEELPQSSENASAPPPSEDKVGGTDTQFNNPFGSGNTSAKQEAPAGAGAGAPNDKEQSHEGQGGEGKTSKREKLKEKLHIGSHK